MKLGKVKKTVAGAAIALFLILGSGIIGVTAHADDRGRWGRSDRRDDRNSSYRQMQMQRAREIARQRQIERERSRDRYRYDNRRVYPNVGGYGSYGRYGGYNNSELERGYRNGLKEGRDDAQDRDSFNPSRHSSFRDSNSAYREGFYRGYQEGYRQFDRYRRW